MPVNWNDDNEVQDFRQSFLDKGGSASEADSFIAKNTMKPETPLIENALVPEAIPNTPNISPEQPVELPKLMTATIEKLDTPVGGFSIGDMLAPEQKQKLETMGNNLPDMTIKNDFGQEPSIPSLAGQEAPRQEQQMIPAPTGTPSKVDFNKNIPQGYQFKARGRNDITGQCAWFAQQITKLPGEGSWKVGNSIGQKKNSLAAYAKKGNAFYRGQEAPKAGNSVIMDVGTRWGHVATVNEVMPDGRIKLTESNWNNDLRVTHNRVVNQNDPSIIGYLRTVPNTKGKK